LSGIHRDERDADEGAGAMGGEEVTGRHDRFRETEGQRWEVGWPGMLLLLDDCAVNAV
jgi:hypothetical protein